MKKRLIASVTCLCLLLIMLLSSTLAWFTDQQFTQSSMTVGKISIKQTVTEADKNILPNVPFQYTVTVKNDGNEPAYLRTIFAFEDGAYTDEQGRPQNVLAQILLNDNDMIVIPGVTDTALPKMQFIATKDGKTTLYTVGYYLHPEELEADEKIMSIESFMLIPEADNAWYDAVDEKYDILVLSQACQVDGLGDVATTALDTSFGEITVDNCVNWFGAMLAPGTIVNSTVYSIFTADELKTALATGGTFTLMNDIDLNEAVTVPSGVNVTLNMNGKTIAGTNTATATHNDLFLVKGELTVNGGTITQIHTGANMGWNGCTNTFDITAGGVLNLNGVTVKNLGGTDMNFAVHMNNWGEVTLNAVNCVLKATYMPVRVFNSGPDMNNVTIKNSTMESTGGNHAFWVHNYDSTDFGGKLYSGASAAYDKATVDARLNFNIYGNGNTFISENKPAPVRYGFNSSLYFDCNGNPVVYVATKEALQSVLDTIESGSVIQLAPGVNYGILEISAQVDLDIDGKTPIADNGNTEKVDYFTSKYPTGEFVRKLENITIVGAPGATVDAIKFVTGTFKVTNPETGKQSGTMYQFVEIKNLVIDGVEFTDASDFYTDAGYVSPIFIDLQSVRVDGLTVKNCTLEGNKEKMNFVYAYGSAAKDCTFGVTLKNVSIINNTVSGIARLCELREAENVTITGNRANNLVRELALFANNTDGAYSGNILIANNYADNIATDYAAAGKAGLFFRVGVGGDANITIKDNVIVNSGCVEDSFVNVTNHTGTLTVVNNTLTN